MTDNFDVLPQSASSPAPSSSSSSGGRKRRKTPPRDRKGGLSCAECRRSKLRCDRNVPCSSCVKRNCAHLCPDGKLPATKGNKALQNRAQRLEVEVEQLQADNSQHQTMNAQLHEQLRSARTRVEELEAALARQQARERSAQPADKPENKGLTGARRRVYGVASGSLAIDKEGLARYYGDTSSSEYFTGLIPDGAVGNVCHVPDFQALQLPRDVVALFNAFPLGLRDRPYGIAIFSPFLPPRNKAMEMAEIFYHRYGCIYGPVPRADFDALVDRIYGAAGEPSAGGVHAHKLALFFAVLAIGHQRSADFATGGGALNAHAERYYVLACAALAAAPLMAEAGCASVQALFLVLCYLGCGTRRGCEESWLLIGVMARVGFRIGLHRDGEQFGLNPAEVQRRRHMFWELYRLDAWISFATGRAPAINLADTDTKFPEFEGDASMMPYPYWKYRYAAACLWPTTRLAGAEVASYEETMALDRKIRTFPVPAHLQASLQGTEVWSWSTNPTVAVQQYCVVSDKELCLVFLHRNYLAVALHAENPLAHRFGGSVLAAYRCATRMCFALRDLYKLHPRIVSSMWYFWSGIFSSCIVLAAIPIMSPGCRTQTCNIAQCALTNLREACQLYIEGAASSPQLNGADMLRRLLARAEDAFNAYWANPTQYKRPAPPAGELDELRLLGGQEVLLHAPDAPRSHSSSPNPAVAAQVSHVRTQSSPQVGPPAPMHGAMHDFFAGAFDHLPGPSAMPYHQQQQPQQPQPPPFAGADDAFMFYDVDDALLSSSIPTYEQIMQAFAPAQAPYAAPPAFPPPEHGFHPAFGAPAERFEQSAFYAAPAAAMGGGVAGPSAGFVPGAFQWAWA